MKQFIQFLVLVFLFAACSKNESGIYMDDLTVINDNQSEKYTDYGENPFVSTSDNPVSTFALDADGGSYANMRRFADYGQKPTVEAVRVEEFVNYFNFDYPEPTSENISLHTELSTCPWNTEHQLLRIGMKGKKLDEKPAANFVLLIDVSGSMNSPNKLGILKEGFKKFVDQMSNKDRIAIVTYAGSAAVLLNSTYGDQKEDIKKAIDKLGAGGSTAGAQGIITAYNIAEDNLIPGGCNRIILGSDGDFNVGPSSTDELVSLIESKRDKGIYLTVIGVGDGNLNDAMMEQIANNGNGNYEYIDKAEQMNKIFIYEYSKFFTVVKDGKIKVEFDSLAVDKYRLIGYENRKMSEDEFNNDSTDAGEVGADQSITAFYEIVPKENDKSAIANIEFRYKTPDSEKNRTINYEVNKNLIVFNQSSENQRFGASVVGLGLLLKESEYKGTLTFSHVYEWANSARDFDPYGFRAEFVEMVKKW